MGGAISVPPYPFQHSGPVIVAGNAWCLNDDLERARRIFSDAPVIAVNGAAGQVKAMALFSMHPLKMPRWIEQQRSRFGGGFTVHGAGAHHGRTNIGKLIEHRPWIDHWWRGVASQGTSAWAARRLAKAMGFDVVVLCGAPLSEGGYSPGTREWAKAWRSQSTIEHYRAAIKRDVEMHAGCYSMSGWTRDILGEPI